MRCLEGLQECGGLGVAQTNRSHREPCKHLVRDVKPGWATEDQRSSSILNDSKGIDFRRM